MSDNPEALRDAIREIERLSHKLTTFYDKPSRNDLRKAGEYLEGYAHALAQQAAAPIGDEVAVDSVAWEGFIKDYDRYNSGDPKLPFSELRASLAAVIASARQAATPAPAEPVARIRIGYSAIGPRASFFTLTDAGRALPTGAYDLYAAPPATPAAQQASQAKPTKAMLEAGMQAFIAAGGESVTNAQVALMFRAMIAATPAAQPADEREAFEKAMRQTWKMIDPLHPPGQPGSYARGEHNGIAAALQTVRENFDRAALKGQPEGQA